MKKLIILFVFIFACTEKEPVPDPPTSKDWIENIIVTDGKYSTTLTIGEHQDATDGYDHGLDQYAPPLPPRGAFGAALVWGNEGYFKDIRAYGATKWVIQYQPSNGREISLEYTLDGFHVRTFPYGALITKVEK